MSKLAYYRETLGFDGAEHIPFTKRYHISCSQCEALVINGIPTHETGCPHQSVECEGCGQDFPKRNAQRMTSGYYCQDCSW